MNSINIKSAAIAKPKIKVYGISGTFTLGIDSSDSVKVRYFSTIASNENDSKAGNAKGLLNELMPMRERVKASALKDFRSLLQRDLSDYRVANELIPYLFGRNTTVGFFPAIVVALMPAGFITGENGVKYPKPETIDNKIQYDKYWTQENYQVGDVNTSLGMLEIDPEKTDLIVLDGQHRANAFRYMCKTFKQATDDTLYSAFYSECEKPEFFKSELPVTILWFESEKPDITPILISRKLFVDVNTNAKTVSESRNILLNDSYIPSIATANFYSKLSDSGFDTKKLSLLHSGFDCDGEFPDDFPKTSLFSPAYIKFGLSFMLYSPDNYSNVPKSIERLGNDSFTNSSRLRRYCVNITDKWIDAAKRGDSAKLDKIHKELTSCFSNNIMLLLEGFNFIKIHHISCSKLKDWVENHGNHLQKAVWEKVFCGGEGLFSAFMSLPKEKKKGNVKTYIDAIESIDKKFIDIRDAEYSLPSKIVSKAYITFSSKAGLAGLLMALEKYSVTQQWSKLVVEKFIKELNKFNEHQWAYILTDYKNGVITELNPKLWPNVRDIYLRAIQEVDPSLKIYDKNKVETFNPDTIWLEHSVKSFVVSWYNENIPPAKPAPKQITNWIDSSLKNLEKTHKLCGFKLFNGRSELSSHLKTYAKNVIDKTVGK